MNRRDILVLGESKRNIGRIQKLLPLKDVSLREIKKFSEMGDNKETVVIIQPKSVPAAEMARLFRLDEAHLPPSVTLLFCEPITVPASFRQKVKVFNNFDEMLGKLKFILLERKNALKKRSPAGNRVLKAMRILSLIQKKPGITTRLLAQKTDVSVRTVQRYIKTLINLDENLYYDPVSRGWRLPGNRSTLWDKANESVENEEEI